MSGLVLIFENYFLLSKTMKTIKTMEYVWFSVFFFKKNIKNIKFAKQKQFSNTETKHEL